jgi:uncharacterized RDD family membrane protein YckC
MDVGNGPAAGSRGGLELQLQGRRVQSRDRRKLQGCVRAQLAGYYGSGEQQMTKANGRDKDSEAEIHQKRTCRLLGEVLNLGNLARPGDAGKGTGWCRREKANFRAPGDLQRPMSCPSNGGNGHDTDSRPARVRLRFRPTGAAEPDAAPGGGERMLIEADGSDVSEQQFAASLETPSSLSRPRFVPDSQSRGRFVEPPAAGDAPAIAGASIEIKQAAAETSSGFNLAVQIVEADAPETEAADQEPAPESPVEVAIGISDESSPGSWDEAEEVGEDQPEWRQEVAARLHNYHSRRRRKPPRYPSLALKFDPPVYAAPPAAHAADARAAYQSGGRSEAATAAAAVPEKITSESVEEARAVPFDATNIIEFPRPLVPPPPRPDELADPILDLPRILDAPEAVSKQVPLGGIILEPEQSAVPSDLELPLRVAPLGRRIMAAGLDGVLVGTATLMFALIVDKIAALLPSIHVLLGLGVALPAILWAVFQYAFLVYTGSTPGMRLIGLRLSGFDGSVPDRGTRRWRAWAMALSAVSLGLGFLWCLLDEDTLCWHDRITRTYLDAGPVAEPVAGPVFPQRFFNGLRRVEAFLKRRAEETSDEAGPLEH